MILGQFQNFDVQQNFKNSMTDEIGEASENVRRVRRTKDQVPSAHGCVSVFGVPCILYIPGLAGLSSRLFPFDEYRHRLLLNRRSGEATYVYTPAWLHDVRLLSPIVSLG